jgi:hypothetical protein
MNMSGYFMFFIMLSWNGKEVIHPICMVGILYYTVSCELDMLMKSVGVQNLRKNILVRWLSTTKMNQKKIPLILNTNI